MEAAPVAGPWTSLKPALRASTHETLEKLQFTQMTPVQANTIPLFMTNKDVVVEAVTGSGKTLAFLIPVIEILLRRETPLKKNEVGAIIIEPTRELAKQVADVLQTFLANIPQLSLLLLTGGAKIDQDIAAFNEHGASIVLGTPGRIDEMMNKVPEFRVKELDILILDEADRLLDLGFELTLNNIVNRLPKQRRTGLFSATMNEGVHGLVRAGLRNAVRVVVKVERSKSKQVQKTPSRLHIYYLHCESDEKMANLATFLKAHATDKIIVYFATCACVDFYLIAMEKIKMLKDVKLWGLHGRLDQRKRTSVNKEFSSSEHGVLLCTDVAARGLDIPDVDWVVQYDPPQDPSDFVHRCGRTARIGKEGSALTLLLPSEETYIEFMKLRKVPMTPYTEVAGVDAELVERVNTQIKNAAKKDREVMEKGTLAFVSFLRSYKEHLCNYIFLFKNLNLGRLAVAFGLLRLPKMPELKDMTVEKFIPEEIDFDTIPYVNKQRERQRQDNLAKIKSGELVPKKKEYKSVKTVAWSDQKDRKEKKRDRREKKDLKRKYTSEQAAGASVASSSASSNAVDMDELNDDYRKYKKSKRGDNSDDDDDDLSGGDDDLDL